MKTSNKVVTIGIEPNNEYATIDFLMDEGFTETEVDNIYIRKNISFATLEYILRHIEDVKEQYELIKKDS